MSEVARFQFFHVEDNGPLPGHKTHTYAVYNNRSGEALGLIQWYGAWRQFCFEPRANTVWSCGCLQDLVGFINALRLKRLRKEAGGE